VVLRHLALSKVFPYWHMMYISIFMLFKATKAVAPDVNTFALPDRIRLHQTNVY
jgi:hypothetical protein